MAVNISTLEKKNQFPTEHMLWRDVEIRTCLFLIRHHTSHKVPDLPSGLLVEEEGGQDISAKVLASPSTIK